MTGLTALKPGEQTRVIVNGQWFVVRMTLAGRINYTRASDAAGYTSRLVRSLSESE